MRKLTNKDLKYIFIVFIIVSIFFITTIDTKGQETEIEPVYYDFSNDVLFDIDQENEPTYHNIRNQSIYDGLYDSYESFEVEYIEQLNEQCTFSQGVDTEYYLIPNYLGHKNVIKLDDNSAVNNLGLYYDFIDNHTSGQVEFWINLPQNDVNTYITLIDYGLNSIYIRFDADGNFKYYDGSLYILQPYEADIWYHIFIDFDCIDGSYDLEINGNIYTGLTFRETPLQLSQLVFTTHSGSISEVYIDSIDLSWTNDYEKNRNLIPIQENTGFLEVDKYEFDYEVDDFETGRTSWYQVEKDASTNQIYIDDTNDINNVLTSLLFFGSVYTQEIWFNGISDSMVLNISMAINPSSTSIYSYSHYFIISPFNALATDDKVVFRLLDTSDQFQIRNVSGAIYETIFTFTQDQVIYINIYINYYDDIFIFDILDGSNHYNLIYDFDINNLDLYGFEYMYFYSSCAETVNPSSFQLDIDYVGIYESGQSYLNQSNDYEFGLIYYQISDSWNSDINNLLTLDSNNHYRLLTHEYITSFKDGYIIRERNNQTELEVINLQDKYDNNYPKFIKNNPYLIFQLYGTCTNMYEIEIEGILLIDDSGNIAYSNYYYNNSDSNSNWFYAEGNKLYYHFNNSESNGIETMKISFNIDDILLDDSVFVSYTAFLLNNYTGQIDFESYYTIESYSISNNISTPNSLYNLTDYEHFTLKQISIIIETDSLDTAYNITEGYIQNINFYPEKPLIPEFEPIEYLDSTFLEKMMETIIPILFFLVPSFMIKTRYGNKAVLPIWILMTFIFMIVNFIPFWIAFIIFLGIGLMTLTKDEVIE